MSRAPHAENRLNQAPPIGLESEGEERHALERVTVKFLELLQRERKPANPKEIDMEDV